MQTNNLNQLARLPSSTALAENLLLCRVTVHLNVQDCDRNPNLHIFHMAHGAVVLFSWTLHKFSQLFRRTNYQLTRSRCRNAHGPIASWLTKEARIAALIAVLGLILWLPWFVIAICYRLHFSSELCNSYRVRKISLAITLHIERLPLWYAWGSPLKIESRKNTVWVDRIGIHVYHQWWFITDRRKAKEHHHQLMQNF